jgi:hypothetical protein
MKIKLTKWGDYEHIVKFPVLSNYFVHVIFTDSIARSRKARYGTEGAAEGAAALSSVAVGGHGHLFFKLDNSEGIIAHEAWHAVFRMFEWAGAELDNEMVAYHLSYLVDRIASFRSHIEFLESNQSSKNEATDGNTDSQRKLAGLQGLSTQSGGAGAETGEARASYVQTQESNSGDGRPSRTTTGRVRTRT